MKSKIVTGSAAAGLAVASVLTAGALPASAATASPSGTASGTTASGTTASGCPTGRLPGYLLGQPKALKPGAAAGDYLWHDAHGWRLAVTHPGHGQVIFTGTISASRPIRFTRVDDERQDVITTSSNHEVLHLRFVNHGYLDGVAFQADCAKDVRFSLQINGHEASPARVDLGVHSVHPTRNPFLVERR